MGHIGGTRNNLQNNGPSRCSCKAPCVYLKASGWFTPSSFRKVFNVLHNYHFLLLDDLVVCLTDPDSEYLWALLCFLSHVRFKEAHTVGTIPLPSVLS